MVPRSSKEMEKKGQHSKGKNRGRICSTRRDLCLPDCHGGRAEGETEGKTLQGDKPAWGGKKDRVPSLDTFERQGSGGVIGVAVPPDSALCHKLSTVGWGPDRWPLEPLCITLRARDPCAGFCRAYVKESFSATYARTESKLNLLSRSLLIAPPYQVTDS